MANIQQQKGKRRQFHIFLASTTSCVINMVVINPLEVAKLRLQYSPATCPQWPHVSFLQLNSCECTQFSYRDSFKGLSISLFHALLSNTMYMQLYEYQRKIFVQKMSPSFATIASAMSSRLMVTLVMNPIQQFRVRFTNSTKQNKIKQSRSGLQATLIRDLTYSCLYWLTIQKIRNMLMGDEYRSHKGNKNVLYANVIPALIGGSFISAITTPLDTIKTRLQSGINMEGSLRSQVAEIYKKEGLTGLFSGVQFRVIRNTISSVLYLTLFQHIIDYLEKPNNFVSRIQKKLY